MKRIALSGFFSLMLVPSFSQGVVSVDIRELKEENDSLKISYVVRAIAPNVSKAQGLAITPMLEAGDSQLLLPYVSILGKNKSKVIARYINNSNKHEILPIINDNGDLEFNISVPYEMWMDTAQLSIRQEVSGYRGHNLITRYQMHKRVELAPRIPYEVVPYTAFVTPEKETKRRIRQGKAYLDFPVGRSIIQANYRRNPEELLKIDEAVRDVVNNPDAVLKGLYVEGFASPEGAYKTNERLSRERALALKEYIRNSFSLDDTLFKVTSVAEDWEGLAALVKDSDLADKDKILEIISAGSEDAREVSLKRYKNGVPYRSMLKDMFPELRRVEYQIDYTVKDYSVEEAKELLKKNPSDLSLYELHNLALAHLKDSPEYNEILMEIIPRQYPNEPIASNNTAAVMLEKGEVASAKRQLEKAGDNASVLNNLGVVAMLEGDLDKAEEYFDKAEKGGNTQASLNKKEVELKRQDNLKMERYTNRK